MKVRIYYDGYYDEYKPQYRKYGFWFNFLAPIYGDIGFCKLKDAIEFLEGEKRRRIVNKEEEVLAKERAKKSGVVYEGEI